ncbi:hypothetical protein NPIL_701111 [Nephila pilipes]|uniref:Uncharacterized protein n=1 Tax=Nephila pilipes TaxID=299642 RepID=A0A8X6MXQ9_NEPPI|nr:hypothetical protein NPIL_701111 [Nephila pilipes]
MRALLVRSFDAPPNNHNELLTTAHPAYALGQRRGGREIHLKSIWTKTEGRKAVLANQVLWCQFEKIKCLAP